MKKILLTITLAVILFGTNSSGYVYAESFKTSIQNADVAISEENFPNAYVRYIIKEKIDKNNDNMLSENEINTVTKLSIPAQEAADDNVGGFDKSVYDTIDCKGLEYFTNLQELHIYVAQNAKQSGLKNFNQVYKLNKLTKLTISCDSKVGTWYFDKLPDLKELHLVAISKVKKIRFGKKIEKLTLESVSGTAKLNLSKVKKLEKFSACDYNLKKINFGTNKNLQKIDIRSSSGKSNKTIKSIDVSGLKNLKRLNMTELKKLKHVKFGNNRKLKRVWIIAGEKFKEIDLKNCRISKVICLNKGVKVKNLWSGYKGLLQFL